MKSLNIDFAGQGGGGHRSGARLWLALALVCAVLAGVGGVAGARMAAQAAALRAQSQDALLERDALRSAAQHQEQLPPDVADSINGVIRMLDYPLLPLLAQLEHFVRPNVSLMSLEIGPVRSNLRFVVQAGNLPEVLDLMEQMRQENAFHNLALTRQEAGGGEGWRFTLELPQMDAVPRANTRPAGRGQE